MTDWWITLLTGSFLLLSAVCLGLREILLRPLGSSAFPNAPFWLCTVMFAYTLALSFTALALLFSLGHPDPIQVHPVFLALSTMMLVYKGSALFNVANQWLPATVWQRLNAVERRMFQLARCGGRKGEAVAELKSRSPASTVIGPGEGPAALIREARR